MSSAVAVSNASRLLVRRCTPSRICNSTSCGAQFRGLSSLVRCRRYPSTSTCASSRQTAKPAQARESRGPSKVLVNAQQRRYESTDKKADAATESSAAETKSTEEVIRQTEEALAKLKESRGANRAKAIEEAFQAAKEQAATEPAVNWTNLRTPVLFGAGLYLGLVMFGNHRDDQKGSDFLAELKASFQGGPKEKDGRTCTSSDGGDDARPKVESRSNINSSSGAASEYEKWKASREGARE